MVELRKRKAPEPAPAPSAKKTNSVKPTASKSKAEVETKNTSSANGALTIGEPINLEGFGGEVETHDGEKTTLQKLVDDSEGGVVLFTYPKASTPGCRSSFP